jgi:APA family basic amino acid/polyamine antiporter
VRRRLQVVALASFAFLVWSTYGVGQEVVFWGFLVLVAGVPLYIWFKTTVRAA